MRKIYLMPTIELDEIVVENGIATSPGVFSEPGENPDADVTYIDGWE